MACFLASLGAAIVATAINKKVPEKYHLDWLKAMLWGGVLMLTVEHIAQGEIIPYPPFLSRSLAEVLAELIEVGLPMVGAIFLVWWVMLRIASFKEKKLNLSKDA